MNESKTIEVEAIPNQTQAIALRQTGGAISSQRMSVEELRDNLAYIREVMQSVMKEGQDYGKVPGCGDKPSLLQPGAQKLCMTFQLQDRVKKEEIIDLGNHHREYRFTLCLVSATGREWDGVGTCSTLEAKYRYRKAERRCPECGHNAIIQGKAEYGGGWLCYKKKNGCGAKFPENDQRITSQTGGTVEHDNPADYWNTVRKMAFKRALVHASINATNTSELWTQDVEDMKDNAENHPRNVPDAPGRSETPKPPSVPTPPIKTAPVPSKASLGPSLKPPTPATRVWMIDQLTKAGLHDIAVEYFQKVDSPSVLMPKEGLSEVPLRFVPNCHQEMTMLISKIKEFANGDRAGHPFPPHLDAEESPGKPASASLPKGPMKDPEAWRDVIVPIPRKGQKRADYVGNEDTLGSLFDQRHGEDEESQAARQRLWGFVNHYEPKGWVKKDGTKMPPSDVDIKFREALDDLADWFEKNHRGEKL